MTSLPEPGQPVLHRRVRTHPASLAAQRAVLAEPGNPPPIRGLATQSTAEPALALLDAFAVVADVVSFYSERHATEGYLRTATERGSVRELARTVGHELRPGLSATTDLVFRVEAADDPRRTALVPAGTPVQSIPGPDEVPQVFETAEDLAARAAWNAIPAAAVEPQVLGYNARGFWLRGPAQGLRRGDAVLVAGDERLHYDPDTGSGEDEESFDLRRLGEVVEDPPGHPGWTYASFDRPLGFLPFRPLVGTVRQRIWHLAERGRLFGATAPDPDLLRLGPAGEPPAGATGSGASGDPRVWAHYDLPDPEHPETIEVDGDRPSIVPGSWVVLEQDDKVEAYVVRDVRASGQLRFGVSGPCTRVRLDTGAKLERYSRRAAMVHFGAVELVAARTRPREAVPGRAELYLEPVDPPLPEGHPVLLAGICEDGTERVEAATVAECRSVTVDTGPTGDPVLVPQPVARLVLTAPTAHAYRPDSLVVHANVVTATHGASTTQVLGSGDGRTPHRRLELRNPPLSHRRGGTSAAGAAPQLTVRVDGVRWHEVAGFDEAGPTDLVYRLEHREGPDESAPLVTEVVFGDHLHGAIPAAGVENIVAEFRSGIGEPGALAAGQLALPVRRPLGIRDVVNPSDTVDWGPPESLEEARVNAPQRIRTLDRVVSVPDFRDLAHTYAGTGQTAAHLVWDGRLSTVVVSVRATAGTEPSAALLSALGATIDARRDPRMPFRVLPAERAGFGIEVVVATDPDHRREDVLAAVRASLTARHGAAVQDLGIPVTAAQVLVAITGVPGVDHCTMPVLRRTAGTDPGGPEHAGNLLVARGARWVEAGVDGSPPGLRAAEQLALDPAAVLIGEA